MPVVCACARASIKCIAVTVREPGRLKICTRNPLPPLLLSIADAASPPGQQQQSPAQDTSGYMDVPAGSGGQQNASGYMDVPAASGAGPVAGYMDVSPYGGDDVDDGEEDV